MKRYRIQLVIIGVLIAGNLWLFFSDSLATSSLRYSEDRFAANAQLIQEVTIGDIHLSTIDGAVSVNGEDAVDPAIYGYLLDILQRVRIRRPVEKRADSEAIPVEWRTADETRSFQVINNVTKTTTFFADEKGTFEVEIPGFANFLGGVFELTADQWKNRRLLEANWRTIQRLELTEKGKAGLNIVFGDNFFTINGRPPTDSTRLVNYLGLFENLQVNERITLSEFPDLDSLSRSAQGIQLTIETIDRKDPFIMTIYPALAKQNYRLVRVGRDVWGVMEKRLVDPILIDPDEFY